MRASTFKAVAIAAFSALVAIPFASAADLAARPYTKAPAMVAVYDWTGFYIGGNAGYSWGRSNSDVSYFNTATGAPIVAPAGSILGGGFDMNGPLPAVRSVTTGKPAIGCGAWRPICNGRANAEAQRSVAQGPSLAASVFLD
jgi:opacity protein-like surface antigen